MNEQLKLSRAEWALVVELLQREHDDLPVEIHHCRVAAYREDSAAGKRWCKGLLDRMQVAIEA